MARRRGGGPTRARRGAGLLGVGLVALAWATWLRPTTLGGAQTYIVVDGTSMEPTYQDGDLVLVREEDRYAVGDIIAFRAGGVFDDPTRIIHRIVAARAGGAFATQGDNRPSLDPWAPTPDDIIGRAVVHVPRLGAVATTLARPPVLAALGGAAVVLGGGQRRRRRRHRVLPMTGAGLGGAGTGAPPRRWASTRGLGPRWAVVGAAGCLLLAVPVLLLGWRAVRADTTEVREVPVGSVRQQVDVDFRFVGTPSSVYPSGAVGTVGSAVGARTAAEPLFAKLLDRLEVAVGFESTATGVGSTSTYAIDTVLSLPQGFTRTLATVPATPFEGRAAQVVSVDLRDVARQVEEVVALTGIPGQSWTVTVTPTLRVEAMGGGASAVDEQAPSVAFVVQDGVIQAQPATGADVEVPVARTVAEPARFALGPLEVETPTARGLLAGLSLVLVVGAGWCAAVVLTGVGLDEAHRIAARYRAQLVDVSVATGPPGAVVLVGGIAELARIARTEQTVILHEDLGHGAHRYRVFLGAVTYEYETAPDDAAGAEAGAAATRPPAP